MPTTEHTINDALAAALRKTRSSWRDVSIVSSEILRLIKGSQLRPDILVTEPNILPVIVETEILPASTVEEDALSRLGIQLRSTGRPVLSSIAVRLPLELRSLSGSALIKAICDLNSFDMALFTGSGPTNASRCPTTGWINGGVEDLSALIQSAAIPPEIVDQAADVLVSGVNEAAGLMQDMNTAHPGAIHQISMYLKQEDSEQTRRMAAAILANAFMFHENLSGGTGDLSTVKTLAQLKNNDGQIRKNEILTEWRIILEVDYWPIFDIARRLLEAIPTPESVSLIHVLVSTAERLLQHQLMRSHDLTGAVFQRLIADRKYLAAFYTTPASASMLINLALSPNKIPTGGSWLNPNDLTSLRIADFACGTGTLLSTAYRRICQLHEFTGGDSETLHPLMMESVLVGTDILPTATHITAAMLSGTHPSANYHQSSILTLAYGKQPDGTVSLGALDLLEPQGTLDILSVTAKAADSMGESEIETWRSLPHATFDVVIMNPPFTRATGHEAEKIGIPNPMFAAFNSSEEEQRLMGAATNRLATDTCYHGNAGEASLFLALADRKLKEDGILALVMPLSLISGDAWEKSRVLLSSNYSDLIVASIAGSDGSELSFSADTGMAECLIVGRKSENPGTRALFVVLKKAPENDLIGANISQEIHQLVKKDNLRCLEDEPAGGTALYFGDEVIGNVLDAPLPNEGAWFLSRIADFSLAQTAYNLASEARVWLPTMKKSEAISVPITLIPYIGKIGPYHSDIKGKTASGGIRGPFELLDLGPGTVPTYPILWSHSAERERTLVFEADKEGIPIHGTTNDEREIVKNRLSSVWNTASHCHFNRDFRFNSQSTGMQFTTRPTIGGQAWPSIQLNSMDQEKALVLWGNTSFGLLIYWWYANKQQSGRGRSGVNAMKRFPILDVTQLQPKQLNAAVKLFDEMKSETFLPFYEIDKDAFRRDLDSEFSKKVLGLPNSIIGPHGPLEILRLKLSLEPSIRGGK